MFDLPDSITFWLPLTNNGTGGKTWSSGVVIDARVASVNEQVFTDKGKVLMAGKAVYTRFNVPVGGYIIEAKHKDASEPVSGSQLVIKSSSNPSITDMNRMLL